MAISVSMVWLVEQIYEKPMILFRLGSNLAQSTPIFVAPEGPPKKVEKFSALRETQNENRRIY